MSTHSFKPNLLLFVLAISSIVFEFSLAFEGIPGLYCGLENCYEVLGATRESNKDDITKLYRSLARKWHPDRFINSAEKATASEKFRQIATAYEILREDESRKDYNDMLDDPEQYYRHYYRYYKRVCTRVDASWVILGVISCISVIQYLLMHSQFKRAIDDILNVPKYRFKAQEMAKQKGLLPISDKRSGKDASGVKRSRHKSKEEIREQEEAILRKIVEDTMDNYGGVTKPDVTNILWIQIIKSPISIYRYLCWYCRWVYLFNIKGEPYGEDEKIYLIRKYLGVSEEQLYMDQNVDSMLRQELYIKEKFDSWKESKDEELRRKLALKPGYKRERRYMKKGGPGQITFLDD